MTQILYYLVFILLIVMTVNNVRKIKTSKNDRNFVNAYSKILNDAEDAKTNLDEYIDSESQDHLLNKARLLKIFVGLKDGDDVTDTVKKLDFAPIFHTNGVFNQKWVLRNSDVFIWVSLIYARTNKNDNKYVLEKVNEKLAIYEDQLSKFVEYNLVKGEYNMLVGEDYSFLRNYLNGEYPPMLFEKRMVTLYKRLASAYLRFKDEKVDEYWENDIRKFSKTMIGKSLLIDLDLYEKYPPLLDENDAILSDDEMKKEEE